MTHEDDAAHVPTEQATPGSDPALLALLDAALAAPTVRRDRTGR